jgi:hypothetical protein
MLSKNCRKLLVIRRVPILAQALVLCLLLTHPAMALNGFTYVGVCACTTTGDFLAGAEQIALAQHPDTGTEVAAYVFATFATYTMVSTTTSRTAYVQVNGQITYHANQRPILVTYGSIAATPVDSAGNSLAAQTESQQESFYTALDGSLWGVSRSEPLEVWSAPTHMQAPS